LKEIEKEEADDENVGRIFKPDLIMIVSGISGCTKILLPQFVISKA
jgi:hypothetical protein